MTYRVALGAVQPSSASVTATMNPGDQSRDWCSRWRSIEQQWARLERPRTESMSAESIAEAERELLRFYVDAYHLKDQLKLAGGPNVECAINDSPDLRLLADLANLEKHGQLDRRPRSDYVPTIGRRKGTTCPGGWRIELEIHHGNAVRDGLAVARAAVEAWRMVLDGR